MIICYEWIKLGVITVDMVVDGRGISLGKRGGRVIVKKDGKVQDDVAFMKLKYLTLASEGVSLSTDLIQQCLLNGVQINILDYSGRPLGILSAETNGNAATVRKQMAAYDTDFGVSLAKEFVSGKLENQISVVKYFMRNRALALPERQEIKKAIQKIDDYVFAVGQVKGESIDLVRNMLFALEGRATRLYWQCITTLVSKRVPSFSGRKGRGAKDMVNQLLNYGYGILSTRVWGALSSAGIEPFAGFLHADHPGRPSMVYDLIEEFRPTVVDHAVLTLVEKGNLTQKEVPAQKKLLPKEVRRELAQQVIDRLDKPLLYEGEHPALKFIISKQAARLARSLRDGTPYKAYIWRW